MQPPTSVTTTLVGNVPSNFSSALKKIINVFQIFYGQLGLPYDISQSQFIKGSGLGSDQKSQIEEASTSI